MKTEQPLSEVGDFVVNWTYTRGTDHAVLRLRGGLELYARRTDNGFKVWQQIIVLQEEQKLPVYVEFDSTSRSIRSLLLCDLVNVESLASESNGKTVVVFRRAPSFYFVQKSRKNREAILQMLEHALKAKDPIYVAVHPATLEILWAQPKETAK